MNQTTQYPSSQATRPVHNVGSADVTDKLILEGDGLAAMIRTRPAAAVGVALMLGFMVGRIASRF